MLAGRKIRSIRKEASFYGWTAKQGKDYCPECSKLPTKKEDALIAKELVYKMYKAHRKEWKKSDFRISLYVRTE